MICNNQPVLLCDVDNIVTLSTERLLDCYQLDTGDFSTEKLRGKVLHDSKELFPLWNDSQILYQFEQAYFYGKSLPHEYAVLALKDLSNYYDIVFYTMHHLLGREYKINFLQHYFPFAKKIVFCNITEQKDQYHGAVFIDDLPNNIIANKSETKILFDPYHIQKAIDNCIIKHHWMEIRSYLIENFQKSSLA